MKLPLLILFFLTQFFYSFLFSQEYDDNKKLKIIIRGYEFTDYRAKKKGHHNLSRKRHYVRLIKDNKNNELLVDKYRKETDFIQRDFTEVEDPKIVQQRNDTVTIKVKKKFLYSVFEELIEQVSIDKCCETPDTIIHPDSIRACCNLTNTDYNIDNRWMAKNITKREILKRAKQLDKRWKFTNEYSMREDRKIIYKGYSNIDSFNVFLKKRHKPHNFIILSNQTNLKVLAIHGMDTILQIEREVYSREPTPWYNKLTQKEIYNPNIDNFLAAFMPKGFLFKDIIRKSYIKNMYIDWILDRN